MIESTVFILEDDDIAVLGEPRTAHPTLPATAQHR